MLRGLVLVFLPQTISGSSAPSAKRFRLELLQKELAKSLDMQISASTVLSLNFRSYFHNMLASNT